MKLLEVAQQKHQLTQQQTDWLKSAVKGKWQINQQTGLVDVNGSVRASTRTTQIPVKFGVVSGDFYCDNTKITSLEGAPSSVGGTFDCYNTKITSLEGAPSSVGRDFYCSGTQITSLEGAPSSVGESFYCANTKITSLQGAPSSIGGSFYCAHSPFVKQHLLQVLRYPQIKKIDIGNDALNALINKHLQGDRDILACQDELIDAGFGAIARL